ncbi:hypothetical protein [Chitinophaga caseinilytica]|uniref:hypothetical protein n=1 Tax=Chitinophaga caseinilytica TaxID=2267521 RepID=UPI003C2C7AD3
MQKIGSFLVIIGLLSIAAGYFDRVPKILMWIYQWGDVVAWSIKIGLVVLGAALFLLAPRKQTT